MSQKLAYLLLLVAMVSWRIFEGKNGLELGPGRLFLLDDCNDLVTCFQIVYMCPSRIALSSSPKICSMATFNVHPPEGKDSAAAFHKDTTSHQCMT